MLKRRASTGIACPCCGSNFDSETRVPFVGSCGDSICAVCVNEKEIKTCPVCSKEGGFACVQKNNLATKLLSVMVDIEANSKKAKLDVEEEACDTCEPIGAILAPNNRSFLTQVINKVPAILDPKNRHFLANILNQLNPISFLNMSSTCKTLNDFCFNSKEVRISYKLDFMRVRSERGLFFAIHDDQPDVDYDNVIFQSVDYSGYRNGFLTSSTGRKKLRNYPFIFTLNDLNIESSDFIDSTFFDRLRPFFAGFPIQLINSVTVNANVDLNHLIQFSKDFHAKSVSIERNISRGFEELGDENVDHLLQNLESFTFYDYVADKHILSASVPDLCLPGSSISKTTFVDLILKFVDSTDEIDWCLGCQDFKLRQDALNSFNLLPFDFEGALPNEYPIIFVKDGSEECWFLRKDGKVMRCYDADFIVFSMCPPLNYPRCVNCER